jgi:predicted lysophospholipase L1 biosynthesis ABC-type transport system permease subunit
MLEKVDIPPAVAPAEFPPQVFAAAASILVFLSLGGSPLKETLGVIYIGVFR